MRFLKALKNKYILTLLATAIWLLCFDRNDVFSQYDMVQKLHKLESERDYYRLEIERNKKELKELQTNTKSLEKFAREKYLMKRDDEDVFVIVYK